jgi:hypothetical protein
MPKQFIFDFVYTDLRKKHAAARHIWDKNKRKFWDREKATKAQKKNTDVIDDLF